MLRNLFRNPSYIYSWVNVYKSKPLRKVYPGDLGELKSLIRELKEEDQTYNFVGTAHSYNGIQCVDGNVAIVFDGRSFTNIRYDYTTTRVTVECGVTIEQLKKFLLPLGRQLLSSGNYMKQKVVSALLTGTHGYGRDNAVMADSIVAVTIIDESGDVVDIDDEETLKCLRVSFGAVAHVLSLTLETKPLEQYTGEEKLIPLNQLEGEIEKTGSEFHALTMFTYSHRGNPSIGYVSLRKLRYYRQPSRAKRMTFLVPILSSILITLLRFVDGAFRGLRPFVQGFVKLLEGRVNELITSPVDIDVLYDLSPLMESQRNPGIFRKYFSPTYSAYNVAVVVPKEQLVPALLKLNDLAFEYSKQSPKRFFKGTIGSRYIGSSEKSAMAGNYQRESYSIDMFFDLDSLDFATHIQDELAKAFDVRPHWGKSIFRPYILDHIAPEAREAFINERKRFSGSYLMRPNLGDVANDFDE